MTNLSTFQATSLSALLVTLEKALDLKAIDERYEGTLRWLTAQTLTAFSMPPHYERPATNIMDLHDKTMSMLKSWMGQDNLTSPDAALDLIRPVMAEEATNV